MGCPYGTHMEPVCKNHMGPIWAAHMGPLYKCLLGMWWWQLLRDGRDSRYAEAFDVDWEFGGIFLAFPFHRVGDNLLDLVLITVYMGAIHVLLGLLIGFRDIWLHGDSHGNTGPIVAFFDRGSWIIIIIGGYFFSFDFQLVQCPAHALDCLQSGRLVHD